MRAKTRLSVFVLPVSHGTQKSSLSVVCARSFACDLTSGVHTLVMLFIRMRARFLSAMPIARTRFAPAAGPPVRRSSAAAAAAANERSRRCCRMHGAAAFLVCGRRQNERASISIADATRRLYSSRISVGHHAGGGRRCKARASLEIDEQILPPLAVADDSTSYCD